MQSASECFDTVKKDYLRFLNKEKIYNKSISTHIKNLKKIYIPLAFWIYSKSKKKKFLIIGLSASQGSGKTTVAAILKIILKIFFKKNICVISIDDFYKTLRDRKKMAEQKHPLFKTRGVPGTHDINLIKNFFNFIKKKNFKKIKLPKFDKSIDDRLKRKESWHHLKKKPEIIILEGWCVGAKPQSNSLIKKPKNSLEKYEDKNLIWRKYVNERLKKDYKKLFNMIDHFIFMKIPNFKMVFKWRLLQERKLKKKSLLSKKIMTYNEIKRFIMFYERITLQMLKDLSKSASIVMLLKKNHEVKKILFR